jgi:hypothetical protein
MIVGKYRIGNWEKIYNSNSYCRYIVDTIQEKENFYYTHNFVSNFVQVYPVTSSSLYYSNEDGMRYIIRFSTDTSLDKLFDSMYPGVYGAESMEEGQRIVDVFFVKLQKLMAFI